MFAAVIFFSAVEPVQAADTSAPANDDLKGAKITRGDSSSIRGNNRFATRQEGESDHLLSGSSVGRNSVWYRWTAWRSGPTEADVCRSGLDTVLAVYTKDGEGGMDKVDDNDDGCSARNHRGGSLVFEAKLEETYWISVSGYSKASAGDFILRLAPALPPEGAAE